MIRGNDLCVKGLRYLEKTEEVFRHLCKNSLFMIELGESNKHEMIDTILCQHIVLSEESQSSSQSALMFRKLAPDSIVNLSFF